jgi:hypothetical protein
MTLDMLRTAVWRMAIDTSREEGTALFYRATDRRTHNEEKFVTCCLPVIITAYLLRKWPIKRPEGETDDRERA